MFDNTVKILLKGHSLERSLQFMVILVANYDFVLGILMYMLPLELYGKYILSQN